MVSARRDAFGFDSSDVPVVAAAKNNPKLALEFEPLHKFRADLGFQGSGLQRWMQYLHHSVHPRENSDKTACQPYTSEAKNSSNPEQPESATMSN